MSTHLRCLVLATFALLVYPANAGAQSFWSVFTELPGDFARLAAPPSLVIFGVTGGGALAIGQQDRQLADRLSTDNDFWSAGDGLGQGALHVGAGLVLFGAGHLAHSRPAAELGIDVLRAQIVSGAITDSIKGLSDRTRPDGGRHSFPSGHSSSAFATAAVLDGRYGWKVGVPAYVLATYIASARLATERHFTSDVVFGAGIGLVAGRAVTFNRGKTSTVTISPMVRHGGPSVSVTIRPRAEISH